MGGVPLSPGGGPAPPLGPPPVGGGYTGPPLGAREGGAGVGPGDRRCWCIPPMVLVVTSEHGDKGSQFRLVDGAACSECRLPPGPRLSASTPPVGGGDQYPPCRGGAGVALCEYPPRRGGDQYPPCRGGAGVRHRKVPGPAPPPLWGGEPSPPRRNPHTMHQPHRLCWLDLICTMLCIP